MTLASALRWSWMNVLTMKRVEMLRTRFKDLDAALEHVSLEMLRELGCREDTSMLAMNRLEEFDPEAYAGILRKRDIRFLSFEDEEYPPSLREISDAPIFLYAMGDLGVLNQPCLGMVGTREMSEYGKRVVGMLVPDIIRAGMVTVSGLAFGIDAEVAKETVATGGRTVAVLGHGLGMIYPKQNERLAEEIVQKGGLILSEFPLDTRPDKYTFPARNRIIAGLSLGTVVVEAALESGSLITAELALEYGREVFAVPGQIFDSHYAGCHQLIARGHAKLVTSASEILTDIGIVSSAQGGAPVQSYTPETPEEEQILKILTTMPMVLDDLAEKTELPPSALSATLTMLEIRGIVKNIGGGKWVRGG